MVGGKAMKKRADRKTFANSMRTMKKISKSTTMKMSGRKF